MTTSLNNIISVPSAFQLFGQSCQFPKVSCRVEALLDHKVFKSLRKTIDDHCNDGGLWIFLSGMLKSIEHFLTSDGARSHPSLTSACPIVSLSWWRSLPRSFWNNVRLVARPSVRHWDLCGSPSHAWSVLRCLHQGKLRRSTIFGFYVSPPSPLLFTLLLSTVHVQPFFSHLRL